MRPRPLLTVTMTMALLAGCAGDPPAGEPKTPAPPTAVSPDSPGRPGAARPGTVRVLAAGLSVPWAVAFLPAGDALVTERDSARLLRVTAAGRVAPVGRVPGVEPFGEGGLMGVAVSPAYSRDRYVFLYLTTGTDNRVVRFRYTDRLSDATPVVTGIPRAGNHNGGRIAFGPDGMLYVATGDAGDGRLAQDRDSLGGKILRVTPEGRPAPGNPFGTRVWTYGHRNVQGLAWDDRGRMYVAEFGQNRLDEINLIAKGRNYGWPEVEGAGGGDRFTDPLLTWSTDEASPSGLAYAGGSLWAAALRGERLWQVPLNPDGTAARPTARFQGDYGRIRAAVRAPDGSLWITTSNKDGRGDPSRDDDRILVVPLS